MHTKDEAARKAPEGSAKAHPTVTIGARSLIAAAAVIGITVGLIHLGSGGASWPLHGSGDAVSPANADLRAEQFATLAPLSLSLVPTSQTAAALDGMRLAPSAKASLAERLPAPGAANAVPAQDPAAAFPSPERCRLAWITLWDTDAEDGDVVRLDSDGYSRTVTLTKKPLTFAVPVPRDGVVKVTGVRDGEGGGITVGLASGASQAVFPIMSVGQTLGLKVSFDR
jgi:hypothetical protein